MPSKETRVELLQGTLDLIVLRALSTMGPQHAYGLAARLEQVADHPLLLNQGTLYPALVRLEQKGWIKGAWQTTENNREAKFYAITKAGSRALDEQTERWRRLAGLVDKLLLEDSWGTKLVNWSLRELGNSSHQVTISPSRQFRCVGHALQGVPEYQDASICSQAAQCFSPQAGGNGSRPR